MSAPLLFRGQGPIVPPTSASLLQTPGLRSQRHPRSANPSTRTCTAAPRLQAARAYEGDAHQYASTFSLPVRFDLVLPRRCLGSPSRLGCATSPGSFLRLGLQLPDAEFPFSTKLVEGEHAFLVWKARSERFEVEDGAGSFVIRGGRIVAQTIFYRLSKGSLDGERQDHRRA
jgi:hypothetical protein